MAMQFFAKWSKQAVPATQAALIAFISTLTAINSKCVSSATPYKAMLHIIIKNAKTYFHPGFLR
jgi:hypothetical protein